MGCASSCTSSSRSNRSGHSFPPQTSGSATSAAAQSASSGALDAHHVQVAEEPLEPRPHSALPTPAEEIAAAASVVQFPAPPVPGTVLRGLSDGCAVESSSSGAPPISPRTLRHTLRRRRAGKKIFVSYLWGDKCADSTYRNQETVKGIVAFLRDLGYSVWFDVDSLNGQIMGAATADGHAANASVQVALVKAIKSCDVALICVSEGYALSPNCMTELYSITSAKKGRAKMPIVWANVGHAAYSPKTDAEAASDKPEDEGKVALDLAIRNSKWCNFTSEAGAAFSGKADLREFIDQAARIDWLTPTAASASAIAAEEAALLPLAEEYALEIRCGITELLSTSKQGFRDLRALFAPPRASAVVSEDDEAKVRMFMHALVHMWTDVSAKELARSSFKVFDAEKDAEPQTVDRKVSCLRLLFDVASQRSELKNLLLRSPETRFLRMACKLVGEVGQASATASHIYLLAHYIFQWCCITVKTDAPESGGGLLADTIEDFVGVLACSGFPTSPSSEAVMELISIAVGNGGEAARRCLSKIQDLFGCCFSVQQKTRILLDTPIARVLLLEYGQCHAAAGDARDGLQGIIMPTRQLDRATRQLRQGLTNTLESFLFQHEVCPPQFLADLVSTFIGLLAATAPLSTTPPVAVNLEEGGVPEAAKIALCFLCSFVSSTFPKFWAESRPSPGLAALANQLCRIPPLDGTRLQAMAALSALLDKCKWTMMALLGHPSAPATAAPLPISRGLFSWSRHSQCQPLDAAFRFLEEQNVKLGAWLAATSTAAVAVPRVPDDTSAHYIAHARLALLCICGFLKPADFRTFLQDKDVFALRTFIKHTNTFMALPLPSDKILSNKMQSAIDGTWPAVALAAEAVGLVSLSARPRALRSAMASSTPPALEMLKELLIAAKRRGGLAACTEATDALVIAIDSLGCC